MAFNFGVPAQSTPNPVQLPPVYGTVDPVEQKVQDAHQNGQLSNSQRVILDSVQYPMTGLLHNLDLAGFKPVDAKVLADRHQRYQKLSDQFIGHPAGQALSTDDQMVQVGTYDRQLHQRQVRDTVQGIGSGKISLGEFRVLNDFGRQTEIMRGQLKGGGYTAAERETLEGRYRSYDGMLQKFLGEDKTAAQGPKTAADAIFQEAKKEGQTQGGFGSYGGFAGFAPTAAEASMLKDHSKGYAQALIKSGGTIEPMDRDEIRQAVQGPTRKVTYPDANLTDKVPMERLQSLFSSVDKSKDGKLTRGELISALSDPRFKGNDARVLAAATRAFDSISIDENASGPGAMGGMFPMTFTGLGQDNSKRTLSLADLKADTGPIQKMLSASYHDLSELPKGPQTLYNGAAGPDLNSLRQGSEGDCWALASMTSQKPEHLKGLLEQRPDGGYSVKFPGRKPEQVAPLTDGERYFYASSNGNWAGVLEKGMRQVMERDAKAAGKDLNYRDIMQGGHTGRATEILTGQASKDFVFTAMASQQLSAKGGPMPTLDRSADVSLDPEKTSRLLTDAFATGKPVTASTLPLNDKEHSRLAGQGHAYSIQGYDPKTQTLTIRNPWGKDESADVDGKDDGVFKMSLKEFQSSFSFMNIGNQGPLPR